jgi:hypothetical protein
VSDTFRSVSGWCGPRLKNALQISFLLGLRKDLFFTKEEKKKKNFKKKKAISIFFFFFFFFFFEKN